MALAETQWWILEGPQPLVSYSLYGQMIMGCIFMALTSSKQTISSGPDSAQSGEHVNYASDIISLEGKRALLSDSSISHWVRAFKLPLSVLLPKALQYPEVSSPKRGSAQVIRSGGFTAGHADRGSQNGKRPVCPFSSLHCLQ